MVSASFFECLRGLLHVEEARDGQRCKEDQDRPGSGCPTTVSIRATPVLPVL